MTLPASGTITLAMIQAEFGGPTPIVLSNYYRGGAYVTANNTSIPTSGTLTIPNTFYGASKFTAYTDSYTTAGSSTATIPLGATSVTIEVWAVVRAVVQEPEQVAIRLRWFGWCRWL